MVPSTANHDRGAGRRAGLWPSEALVSDIVGRIIEFWGFKRNMGRVWAVLYLSHEPLTAQEVVDRLEEQGCHSRDIDDALFEADPMWLNRLEHPEDDDDDG